MITVDEAREALIEAWQNGQDDDEEDVPALVETFEAAIRAESAVLDSAYRLALRQIEHDGETINRLIRALRVATHSPHDQNGEPNEGFPVCSVCGAIQTGAESAETLAALRSAVAVEMQGVLAEPDDPFIAGSMAAYNHVLSLLAAAPAEDDTRSITLHPGQHEFRTICRLCGDEGMLHVSLITHHERVTISDPRTVTPAEDEEGRT